MDISFCVKFKMVAELVGSVGQWKWRLGPVQFSVHYVNIAYDQSHKKRNLKYIL